MLFTLTLNKLSLWNHDAVLELERGMASTSLYQLLTNLHKDSEKMAIEGQLTHSSHACLPMVDYCVLELT